MVKKIEDMFNRLHTIPACDRQTDGRTDRHIATAYASRGKNAMRIEVGGAGSSIHAQQCQQADTFECSMYSSMLIAEANKKQAYHFTPNTVIHCV